MSKIIDVRGPTKVFPPSARVVDEVSFMVGEGKIFSLLGPNGVLFALLGITMARNALRVR
jgi:ABC-type Na+ transport system ATPase subunit NatA